MIEYNLKYMFRMNNMGCFYSAFTITVNRSERPPLLPHKNRDMAEIAKVLLITGLAVVFIGFLWLLQNFMFTKLCTSTVTANKH